MMNMIRCALTENVLTVFLPERVDTVNASALGDEMTAALSENPHGSVILNAEKLQYISSAGLRAVLRVKKAEKDMKIVGVCAEVYEIFDMTGFTELMPIEKAYRRLSVEGCDIIGKGAKGTVYRYNADTILKVYKNPDSLPDIKRERELARRAFVLGIPTAISYDVVKVGESYGSVFELLDARSYSDLIAAEPDKTEEYAAECASLLRKIHETEVRAEDMPDVKKTVRSWADAASPFLAEEDAKKLYALIEAVPDRMTMLHCDFHTNNVMSQGGEAILIDMDTLSHGHPVFELANVYITYVGFGETDPTVVEKFLGMPYSLAGRIWNAFLPAYLGTTDPEKQEEVEKKVRLLSCVRLLRHTARRGLTDTPEGKKTVALCKANISSLLRSVSSLEF